MRTWGSLPLPIKILCFLGLGGFAICIAPFKFLNPLNQFPWILLPAGVFFSAVTSLVLLRLADFKDDSNG